MKKKYVIGGILLYCTVVFSAITLAEQPTGGDFTITKSTIDAGGGVSKGGDFTLTGTIGQPDASTGISTGGQFKLAGGFWANATGIVLDELIFKDSFETL